MSETLRDKPFVGNVECWDGEGRNFLLPKTFLLRFTDANYTQMGVWVDVCVAGDSSLDWKADISLDEHSCPKIKISVPTDMRIQR